MCHDLHPRRPGGYLCPHCEHHFSEPGPFYLVDAYEMSIAGLAAILAYLPKPRETPVTDGVIAHALSEANAAFEETRRIWDYKPPDLQPCICDCGCQEMADYNDCLACVKCQEGCPSEEGWMLR